MGSKERQLVIEIQAKADQALSELRTVSRELDAMKKSVRQANKTTKEMSDGFGRVGKSLNSFSNTLKGVVAAYASLEGAKSFVTLLGETEKGFIGVQKTTGLAGEEFEKLKSRISELSTEMSGVSLGELQSIAETAGQLGVQGVDNIEEFTRVMAMMGVATKLTAEEAATKMAQLGNALGIPIKDFERFGSAIDALSNSTNALAGDVIEYSQRIAGVGKIFGLSSTDVLGFAATLKDLGVSAELGGTAVQDMMMKMIQNTGDFAKVAGVSMEEFSRLIKEEPVKAIEMFLTSLGKMDKSAKVKALNDLKLSGSGAAQTMLKLSGATDMLNKNIKESATAWRENVALQNEVKAASDGLDAQFQKTKNILINLALKIGEQLLPKIKQLNEDFQKWVQGLDEQKLKAFGDQIVTLVDGIAKVAVVIGEFVTSIASFASEFPKLSAALILFMSPLGKLITVIPNLGTAFSNISTPAKTMQGSMKLLTTATGTLRGAIGSILRVMGPGGALLAGAFVATNAAVNAYTESVKEDIAVNKQVADTLNTHADRMNGITSLYLKAQGEIAKYGTTTKSTHDAIEQALKNEIATIEKQLGAWERSATSTEEQNQAAHRLSGTLGQLKAQLDTLDAEYGVDLTVDTSDAEQKIEEIKSDDGTQVTVDVTADTAEAKSEIETLGGAEASVVVNADTAPAEAAIGELKQPTDSTHTVKPNANAAMEVVKRLQHPTQSTHTIYVRTVETHALGGKVGEQLQKAKYKFAKGGRIPGDDPHSRDDVPILASRGEWVINRKAVRFYGDDFLRGVNQMLLPKFAGGGSVASGSKSATPTLQPINLHIGGQQFGLMGDAEVAAALARYIEKEGGL